MSIVGRVLNGLSLLKNFRVLSQIYVKTQDEGWYYRLGADQRMAWKHIIGETN